MDKKDQIKQLQNQIWTTRISRVNAEKRLVDKNSFIQGINIYYSCVTIIFSILSVVNNDNKLGLVTTFMTIAVLIAVLYLNSLRYVDVAREYRLNYTRLHKLELQLTDDDISPQQIKEIKEQYCDLLDSACNHITFDYYRTIAGSKGEYKTANWDRVKHQYRWGCLWRFLIKVIIMALPVAIYIVLRYA